MENYNTIDDIVILKSGYDIEKLKKECNIITKLKLNREHKNQYGMDGWDKYPLYSFKWDKYPYITLVNNKYYQDAITYGLKPTKYLDYCPYIRNIINSFNTNIYHCVISKLEAEKNIHKHKDMIQTPMKEDFTKILRVHLPIITNPDVEFFIGDPILKKHYLKEGVLYFTRTGDRTHKVYNNSDSDRYYLIIDLKPTHEILDKILL